MGKKLDALLGRSFKTSKFKGTASLAVSRLAVLKNQRQARCSVARSDVVQFLNNGNHERALLRVEQVIKEQNMLDVFVVLEGYCHLLLERVNLFEQEKFCPEELIEAVSTLIYASTRCGDFPELQELRAIFTSRFGREFVARAVELRNNCGVNLKIIQKLSTKMQSLENKFKVLNEIASENNIELPKSDIQPEISENSSEDQQQTVGPSEERERESGLRRKYKDVADAAQAAFESANYAAAAARIAVELSRSESADLNSPREKITAEFIHQDINTEMKFDKLQPSLENDDAKTSVRRSFSASSSDSSDEEGDDGDGKGKYVVFEDTRRNETDFDEKNELGSRNGELGKRRDADVVEPLDISRRPISVRSRWARAR